MKQFGPRAMTPRDGLDWLRQALMLMVGRPALFVGAALLAPAGSAMLLALPVWDTLLPGAGGWLTVIATVICYGAPLALAVNLACGFARAANRQTPQPLRLLLVPTTLKILLKSAGFLAALLLQGYLAVYLVHNLINPADIMANMEGKATFSDPTFGVADTILGTQLLMTGGLLLVLQFLFAFFVAPLYLFREFPLYECWRLSFMAIQLNPWLVPAVGLPGLVLLLPSYFESLSVLAQVLALPLPAYLGALLYVAWMEIFQGGLEQDAAVREEALA